MLSKGVTVSCFSSFVSSLGSLTLGRHIFVRKSFFDRVIFFGVLGYAKKFQGFHGLKSFFIYVFLINLQFDRFILRNYIFQCCDIYLIDSRLNFFHTCLPVIYNFL